MSISWKIINLDNNVQIQGHIEKGRNLSYDDIIISIYQKHAYHPSFIFYEISQLNLDISRQLSKISNPSFMPNYMCKQINLFYKLNKNKMSPDYKFYIPDCSVYKLAIFKPFIFRYNEKINNHLSFFNKNIEKIQINCVIKILKETQEYYIVKLPDYLRINIGIGPTINSTYAFVQKYPKYIYAIDFIQNFELDIVKYNKEYKSLYEEYKNIYSKHEIEWESFKSEVCCVCLEDNNLNDIHCYCSNNHLSCCSHCIKSLLKCPICSKKIINYDQVIFI